jgi:signal transduction histidine kinase
LFIAREIVRAHGGEIWAESKLGTGSVFRFSLPLAQASETL